MKFVFGVGLLAAVEFTPTMIICISIAAVAVLVAIVLLCLLLVPYTLTLELGETKRREKHPGHVGLELGTPKRDGYVFDGWYEDAAFTRPVGKVYRMPARSCVLYAKWIAEPPAEAGQSDETEVASECGPESADVIPATAEAIPSERRSEQEKIPEQSPSEEVPEEEPSEESESEAEEGDEIDNALVTLVSGGKVFVQYRRSFRARLIQAADETKAMYNRLRNEIISYLGVKERVSWNYDSYNAGRRQFVKVNVNTKSLIVYFALAPSEIGEKYRFRDVSQKKRYAAVPVRYKVTGSRSLQYAIELLEQTAGAFGLDFRRTEETLVIPYQPRDELIREKLIKVYAKRETGEQVTEEQLEEFIAEGATVEPLSAYTVTDEIAMKDAESLITDATAKQLIALAETKVVKGTSGKRTYINLDTISANYSEGETVDLQSLKQKGLIDKRAVGCKILARGALDKALTVEATDFSLAAVKMIALTGGKVVRIKNGS